MNKNTWYSIAQTTSSEAQGRLSFTIGETVLLFDVIIQYGNVSLGIVQYTGKLGVFSIRVCRDNTLYRIDIRSTRQLSGEPVVSVSASLGTFTLTSFDAQAEEATVVATITTEDNVTIGELEDILENYYDRNDIDSKLVGLQADWAENDPTAPSYIRNRTHYKNTEDTIGASISLATSSLMSVYIEMEDDTLKALTVNGQYTFTSPHIVINPNTSFVTDIYGPEVFTLRKDGVEEEYVLALPAQPSTGLRLVRLVGIVSGNTIAIASFPRASQVQRTFYFGNILNWDSLVLYCTEGQATIFHQLDERFVDTAEDTDIDRIISSLT